MVFLDHINIYILLCASNLSHRYVPMASQGHIAYLIVGPDEDILKEISSKTAWPSIRLKKLNKCLKLLEV